MQAGQVYPREHQVQDEEEGVPVSSQWMENQAGHRGECLVAPLSLSFSIPSWTKYAVTFIAAINKHNGRTLSKQNSHYEPKMHSLGMKFSCSWKWG